MKLMRAALVFVLSYALGVQPSVAAVVKVQVAGPSSAAGASVAAGSLSAPSFSALKLSPLGLAPSAVLSPSLVAPAPTLSLPALASPKTAVPALSAPSAQAQAQAQAAAPLALSAPVSAPKALAPFSAPGGATPAEKVSQIQAAADEAVKNIERASGAQATEQAAKQFSALTGEKLLESAGSGLAVPASEGSSQSGLAKGDGASGREAKAEPPQPEKPKTGFFRVFRDSARNSAFWRYITGYSIFLFGFEMYVVGLPYLVSSMTANGLREANDARAGNAEAVKELVRSNRSMGRIAHWVAQAVSYATVPLFTRNVEKDGPRKWLVRSMLIRAAILAAVPAVFFATGVMGLTGAMWTLFGLIALQSFFQGITVTTEGASTARLMGDKSVTPEERTKANSIITVVAAVITILGPVVAGQIAQIGPVMGKNGVGGAVIYGVYALTVGIAGLIYASIKLFGAKGQASEAKAEAKAGEAAPTGLGGTLKKLWTSIKDGTRLILKDRLLRTMLMMSMISSLFSDPLVFNVLPEYIEGLVTANGGTLGAVGGIPVLGPILKMLSATPMGNFAMMMLMASVGSIVATLLMKPLTKLLDKLGFKSEKAKTIPLYIIAALEAPLFIMMINTPTILGVIGLYGLQALATAFVGIAISGHYQENLGKRADGDVNKVLAANSLIGIVAAIISTFAYGFLLKDIAIGTSLLIAGIAIAVMGALRIAAPFLMFSKEERKRVPAPKEGEKK